MPKFAAVIADQIDVLKDFAPFFNASDARIRLHNKTWVLESEIFESLASADDVFDPANQLLRRISEILALYVSLHAKLSASAILQFDTNGKLVRNRLRAYFDVQTISSSSELATKIHDLPLGNRLLKVAYADTSLAAAFGLLGFSSLTWPQIFNLMEYLGGENEIVKTGLATRAETRRMRQTANHYRHLGAPKLTPLPANAPKLGDGVIFISGVLKKWIDSRFGVALNAFPVDRILSQTDHA